MDLWHAIILSLVQGITEFLPISSSGHLVITRELLGWPEAGAAFDAFTGLGTLTAVIVYFFKDIMLILKYWFGQFRKTPQEDPEQYARLGNLLIIATIPALVFGFLIKDSIDTWGHNPILIASTTIIFGIVLGIADWIGKKQYVIKQTKMNQAIIYGLAQAVSLIPGTSRSGITMSAGLMMGFSRQAAARFSFLMSIPIGAAAGLYGLLKMLNTSGDIYSWQVLLVSYVVSAASAFICIAVFLRFLNAIGMWPHVVYRLLLGSFLLYYFL